MDVWEILTGNSTLTPISSYDAWEHLNAQSGGGSVTIFADDLTVALEDNMLELQMEDAELTVAYDDQELQATIEDTEYILEVCLEDE